VGSYKKKKQTKDKSAFYTFSSLTTFIMDWEGDGGYMSEEALDLIFLSPLFVPPMTIWSRFK
jgi:hypothetical protein